MAKPAASTQPRARNEKSPKRPTRVPERGRRFLGRPNRIALAALAVIGMLFALWQIVHVRNTTYGAWANWSSYDEGVYLVSARALDTGQVMFQQVFSSQPPLFLGLLALTLKIAGGSAGAGHVYTLCCALMALAGVAWIGWEIGGRRPAVLGAALLALSPGFVIAARAIEAEAPMLGFGSLAVAASVRYARLAERRWMIMAALLLSAATLSKLLAVGDAAPIALALLLAPPPEPRSAWLRRIVTDAVLALAAFAGPIAALFLLLHPAEQYDQVIRFHLKASEVNFTAGGNAHLFQVFLGWDPGLVAMAVAGVAAAALGKRVFAILPLVWLVTTAGSMVNYQPLFIHHLTVLLAPFAALAGLAAVVPKTTHALSPRRIGYAAVVAVGGAVYLVWLPVAIGHDRNAFVADHNPVTAAEAGWLAAQSGPNDLVVADDQELAVAANRLVPSALTDTSIVRYNSGYLALPVVIGATDNPRVKAILLTRKLHAYASYVAWVRTHFQEVSPPPVPGALAFIARDPHH